MLEALDDPYSVYYTTEEVEKRNETISGTYTGIGAYVSRDSSTGCPKIAGVIAGAPAEKAGLQADDILWKADGELLQDLELDMAVSRIKGEKGTAVHLTVIRDGKEMEFDVTREEVHSETVAGKMLENQIGYLQIAEFDDVTPEQFTEELEKLQDQGMKGLIVDLRNNPGGTVEAVTSIAQHLIPEGLVFYMQYPDGSRKARSILIFRSRSSSMEIRQVPRKFSPVQFRTPEQELSSEPRPMGRVWCRRSIRCRMARK